MTKKILTVFVLGFLIQAMFAQNEPKTIRANSLNVDIKNDNHLRKNAWKIAPEINPDIYITNAKKVTFYTDIDSITFDLNLQKQYDFVILLHEKDSAKTRVVYEPSKLDILKKAGIYDDTDNHYIPQFSYQSKDNPNLIKVRNDLKLDSIAGSGSELSKIFNLMHWVHNIVRHDGSSSNPTLKNAIDLINVCKAENRGINCRMMAIILNECYLSMGIKSRYVSCMPKDRNDTDSHVINMVYSNDLNKWIWIDPTFDAYVMDEKGNLLGIQEVRERLINDEPLILNADANWNRKTLQRKEYYLQYYMAKNLYRLKTPLISEYNAETFGEGKEVIFIELFPLDDVESLNEKHDVQTTNHKISNPNLFWTKP